VTNVYVDAFNLYYGSLKGTPYRWLDLGALCARLLPKDQINRIRYFTATVSARARQSRRAAAATGLSACTRDDPGPVDPLRSLPEPRHAHASR
jgi:hypothetical protein